MITLDTPIIIYPDEYNGQFVVRLEVEMRTMTAYIYLSPTRSDQHNIYLGTKERIGDEWKVKYPELLRTMSLQQNINDPDPVITDFFDTYILALQKLEKILVDNQHEANGLASVPVQIGTTEWDLTSKWTNNGGREVGFEDITPTIKPTPPEEE